MSTESAAKNKATGLAAYRATQEDSFLAELRVVADQATAEDVVQVEELTTPRDDKSASIVSLTPAVGALIFLDHNAHNRDLRIGVAREYARRLKDGEWFFNNATIGFYTDGNLEDGQHRCAAIALSGVTVEDIAIVTGISKNAIATIDDGTARHGHDAAKLDGIIDARRKQQIVKGAAAYRAKNGDKSAALHSEFQIAEEIRSNDDTLSRALGIGDRSTVGITKPSLKGMQAHTLAYLFLNSGWPETLVYAHLAHMQAGASSTENDKEPRFLGMDYIAKARESKARADRLSAMKELGIIVYSIVEAQRGTKALNRSKIREAVKGSMMPDPHFPADAEDLPVAAE